MRRITKRYDEGVYKYLQWERELACRMEAYDTLKSLDAFSLPELFEWENLNCMPNKSMHNLGALSSNYKGKSVAEVYG